MNWLIYGDIMETHVVYSLIEELENLGHTVYHLDSLKRGHEIRYKTENEVQERLLQYIEGKDIDALFNFRANELTPKVIEEVKKQGIKTFVWFPDDPLLYEICYKHVAPYYDITLHCGKEDVLQFYEEKLGVKGFAFPFWSNDTHFPYQYDPVNADIEVGFLGNCTGKQRADRYDILASIPYKTQIFGKLENGQEDWAGIHGGYISNFDEIPAYVKRFKVAINFAQKFEGLEGTIYYFPELAQFKEFYFPSRIIQYAGVGVPIINVSQLEVEIPSVITVRSGEELLDILHEVVNDDQKLMDLSRKTRKDFERYLSARSRAEFLTDLYNKDYRHLPASKRATLWKKRGSFLNKILTALSAN